MTLSAQSRTDSMPAPAEAARATDVVLSDHITPCPYLPDEAARMPLRLPLRPLDRGTLDQRLAAGDRRSGAFLYHLACPACQACQPLRIDVDAFRPSRTQRRVARRGQQCLTWEIRHPAAGNERLTLFNRHRLQRGLAESAVDRDDLCGFLVDTCCETLEIDYYLSGRLVAVAIADRGTLGMSAVYCYYDADLGRLSLGTYSVLNEIEICRSWQMRYLYLGLYNPQARHLAYKARFRPHERLIQGRWQVFE